ncbi:MAG: S49 family peptidase, partial [Rhodobacteraceae bacterium]|nr:S49 family peptidase [Paracoccaceae bacterium]
GYWLASCADEIFADPASIVGSIGVISAGFGLQDLIARYGIERRVYTAGKSKSMLDPFREEKQEDVERLTSILGDVHDVFIQHVKTMRADKITQEIDVFTGEVWLAKRAKELGLIDEIGHLVPTLKDRFGEKVKLRVIEQKRSFSQRFGLSISDSVVGTLEERIALSRFGL